MALININIPDAVSPRVLNAMAGNFRYQDTIDGVSNPETKAQFAKRQVQIFLKDNVKSYESGIASRAATLAAINSVETDIVLA